MSSLELSYIGDCKFNDQDLCIFRDQDGKFYVKVNGITTQKRLIAKEIVCYLLNAMNEGWTDAKTIR